MSKFILPGTTLSANNVFCIGRNYADHAKELNNPVPSAPIVFLKPNSSLCTQDTPIVLPSVSSDVHHEVELVLAIGKTGKNIKEEDAQDFIHSVGLGIDFTARDIQQKAKDKGHPWSVAKGFDTFAPVSNFIPSQEIDFSNSDIQLSVNGSTRQSGNTSDMLFSIPKLIAYLSTIFTLNEGDLIFTGTPAGVAAIKSGDVLKASLNDSQITLDVQVS
jgi:2-keto-4-pentenoate hydratase/2-oxohepta-3-ene-1,7-dioic acid hydratase in catechol pathway